MLPIESDLYISAINYSFDIKLKVTKIESCQKWKLPKVKVAKIESSKFRKLPKLKVSSAFFAKLPNS